MITEYFFFTEFFRSDRPLITGRSNRRVSCWRKLKKKRNKTKPEPKKKSNHKDDRFFRAGEGGGQGGHGVWGGGRHRKGGHLRLGRPDNRQRIVMLVNLINNILLCLSFAAGRRLMTGGGASICVFLLFCFVFRSVFGGLGSIRHFRHIRLDGSNNGAHFYFFFH